MQQLGHYFQLESTIDFSIKTFYIIRFERSKGKEEEEDEFFRSSDGRKAREDSKRPLMTKKHLYTRARPRT